MSNIEIRRKAKENGVHLSEAEKEQIFKIIDDLKECDKND